MATVVSLGVQAIANRRAHWETSRQGKRLITPEAGRALELLGHAIEYLADEYMLETKNLSPTDPQVAAILLRSEEHTSELQSP